MKSFKPTNDLSVWKQITHLKLQIDVGSTSKYKGNEVSILFEARELKVCLNVKYGIHKFCGAFERCSS